MGYRMDSAKPAIMKHGYAINYDKEIAEDERRIAYLTSEFATRMAAWVDSMVAKGVQNHFRMDESFIGAHEVFRDTLDIVVDDLRALWVYLSRDCDQASIPQDPYGPAQTGDYARGDKLLGMPVYFPLDADTLWDWRPLSESGRKEALRLAKDALSRHKRNKEKYGR